MPSITLQYDNATSGPSQTFTALTVKGFKPAEHHVVVPRLRWRSSNGAVRKSQAGFRRIFTVDLGTISDAASLEFLGGLLTADEIFLTYTYTTTETDLPVILRNGEEFASDWADGVEIKRRVILEFEEASMRTSYPGGYGNSYGTDYGTQL